MTNRETEPEPSIIVPSNSQHSRYESRTFHDIRAELQEELKKHPFFDPARLDGCLEDKSLFYFGPELTKKAKQKTLPDDNRAIEDQHEYTIRAYRDNKIPENVNPLSFLADKFRQYVQVDYWNGRNFTLSFNLKGEFEKFKLGVWEHSEISLDNWEKNSISDEEFMRLTRKYFSPEHFKIGCNLGHHHSQHQTNLKYIVESFLRREK